MSFTEKKFSSLKKNNKIKKIIVAINEYLEGGKEEAYPAELLGWLNIQESESYSIPNDRYEWGLLKSRFLQLLNIESGYSEDIPYDEAGSERRVLPLKVLLDNIRSPFNAGSIIRSAEALGAKEVILGGITPGPDNAKVMKTARHALSFIREAESPLTVVKEHRSRGGKVVALEKTRASLDIGECDYSLAEGEELLLILGNEEFGVNEELLELSDLIVHIPMLGIKNSINVSVAAGIALYRLSSELRR